MKQSRMLLIIAMGGGLWFLAQYLQLFESNIFETLTSYSMYPILVMQKKIVKPIQSFFERKKTMHECYALIKELQSEREDLLAQNIQLNAMLDYAGEIKELVAFKKQYGIENAILSQVLVKHFSDQAHYFLLDKGSNAGVQEDMVVVYKNCLVGRIVQVYPYYSKVALITDKQCKVAAFCVHTQATGIYEGSNSDKAGLKYVSHLAEIEPDDLILSSGDGLVFPRGFLLGKISSCKPEGLFYEVIAEPMIDFHTIDFCYVMHKGVLQPEATQAVMASMCEEKREYVEGENSPS